MTRWQQRLPFYYGWVIIFIAFVTMAVAVSARTSFSLLVPPLIDEFGWDRGLVAGAFSFGFMMSAVISPSSAPSCRNTGRSSSSNAAWAADDRVAGRDAGDQSRQFYLALASRRAPAPT